MIEMYSTMISNLEAEVGWLETEVKELKRKNAVYVRALEAAMQTLMNIEEDNEEA